MKKILVRKKDKKKQLVMPEKYKGCSIGDAVVQACGDDVYDILKLFGINAEHYDNEDNPLTNITIEFSILVEKAIREHYNIPEDQVYVEEEE